MRRSLALVILAICSVAHGQSGEWGSRGITRRILASGNRVYAADGRGVAVYDVSQSTVRRVGVAETSAESLDVALIGDRDLAVATRAGIERYEINPDGSLTDLANYPGSNATVLAGNSQYVAGYTGTSINVWRPDMSIVAIFPLTQPVAALAWHRNTLVAAMPGTAIMLFDPSGDRPPVTLAERAEDVEVAGDRLWAAVGVDGVVQYDISNDSSPVLVSRSAPGDRNFTRIAVGPTRVVAAEAPSAIDVFDVSSGTPALANRFEDPVQTIAMSGSRLFVGGSIIDRYGETRELGEPLRVFDLTVAAAPVLAAVYSDLAGPLSGVATDGTLAYVSDFPFFRVIDVSTTTAPREISSIIVNNIGDHVRVRGNLAILYGRGQVQIVDVSNPYAPAVIKTWDAQGGPPSTAAFLGDNFIEANPFSGFHVVDFTHFATPGQIGGIKGHYYDVASNGGDVAYVAQEAVTLATIDVADSHAPSLVTSTVIAPLQAEIAAATANHPELIVVQTKSAIRIYSVANSRSPLLLSSTPTMTTGVIATDGDAAYVAMPGSVQKIDLRDPAHPQFAATGMRAVAPIRIASANGKVVIADKYSLRIYGPNTAPPAPAPPQRRRVADH